MGLPTASNISLAVQLEALHLGFFLKKRDCTNYEAKTKTLIRNRAADLRLCLTYKETTGSFTTRLINANLVGLFVCNKDVCDLCHQPKCLVVVSVMAFFIIFYIWIFVLEQS